MSKTTPVDPKNPKSRNGRRSSVAKAASPGKTLEAASLLAAGLVAGGNAVAAIRPETSSDQNQTLAVGGSESLPAELQSEQLPVEGDPQIAAEDAPASDESLELAEGGDALGIVGERPAGLDEPMQLAQAQTQTSNAPSGSGSAAGAGGATGAGSAAGGAGGAQAGGTAAGAEAGGAAAGADAAAAAGAAAGAGTAGIAAIAIGGLALASVGETAAAAAAAVVGAPVVGFAAKGPLSNATVFYDINDNGILDGGDIQTTTAADGSGSFSFSATDAALGAGHKLIVQGGTYTKADGTTATFTGKLISDGGTAITVASTMKAAGMSNADIAALLGKDPATFDPNALTASDFNPTNVASVEDEAMAVFQLIDQFTSAADDGDKVLLLAKVLGDALAAAVAAGASLSDPDVIANINTLMEGALQQASAAFDADPTLTATDPLITNLIADYETTVTAQGVGLGTPNAITPLELHNAYAASIGGTWNGTQYVLTETQAEALLAAGTFNVGDRLDLGGTTAGAAAGQLVVVAEGTLLGASGDLLTGDELAILGVDVVEADAGAPYLHLLMGNLATSGGLLGGAALGAAGPVVIGTEFSPADEASLSGLGVDIIGSQFTDHGQIGGD